MGCDYFLVNYTKKQYFELGHKSQHFEGDPVAYIKKILQLAWNYTDKIHINDEYEIKKFEKFERINNGIDEEEKESDDEEEESDEEEDEEFLSVNPYFLFCKEYGAAAKQEYEQEYEQECEPNEISFSVINLILSEKWKAISTEEKEKYKEKAKKINEERNTK